MEKKYIGIIFGLLMTLIGCGSIGDNAMKPSQSEKEFKKFAENSGRTISDINGVDAVELMLTFYRDKRAKNCPIESEGDMLLYQWGTYDRGKGKTFNFNITRQFILKGSEGDDGMSQLSLTLHFQHSEELEKIKDGNKWCESPSSVDNFKRFILQSEAYNTIKDLRPLRVEIDWGGV